MKWQLVCLGVLAGRLATGPQMSLLNTECVVRRLYMLNESMYEAGLKRGDSIAAVADAKLIRGC
jgi:hypothetical protein